LLVPILAISLIVTLLSALGMIYVDNLPDRYHLWAGYQIFYQFDVGWLGALNFSFYEVFFAYDPSKTYIPPAWTMRPELFASTILYVFLFGYYLLRLDRLPVLIWIPFAVAVFMTKGMIPGLYYFGYFLVGYVIYSCYIGAARQDLFSPWLFVVVVSAKSILFFFAVKGLLVDFLFASLLVFSILFSSTLQSLFANRLFGWLGKISFPLYLIHVPIITTMGMYNFVLLDVLGLPPLMGGMINFTVVMAACLGVAHLLTFVDTETLRLLRVMKSRAGLTIKARAEESGARL
jgi:peptidoglycan/LPS O-acetylase OafA/YrhL